MVLAAQIPIHRQSSCNRHTKSQRYRFFLCCRPMLSCVLFARIALPFIFFSIADVASSLEFSDERSSSLGCPLINRKVRNSPSRSSAMLGLVLYLIAMDSHPPSNRIIPIRLYVFGWSVSCSSTPLRRLDCEEGLSSSLPYCLAVKST